MRNFASEAAEFKGDTEGMAWLGLFNGKGNKMPEDLDAVGSLERAGVQVRLSAFLSRGEASRLARTTWARAVRRDTEQREGQIGLMQKLSEMPGEQQNFKVFQTSTTARWRANWISSGASKRANLRSPTPTSGRGS